MRIIIRVIIRVIMFLAKSMGKIGLIGVLVLVGLLGL